MFTLGSTCCQMLFPTFAFLGGYGNVTGWHPPKTVDDTSPSYTANRIRYSEATLISILFFVFFCHILTNTLVSFLGPPHSTHCFVHCYWCWCSGLAMTSVICRGRLTDVELNLKRCSSTSLETWRPPIQYGSMLKDGALSFPRIFLKRIFVFQLLP